MVSARRRRPQPGEGRWIDNLWYGRNPLSLPLVPLSWVFQLVSVLRRKAYTSGLLAIYHARVPVIVVGNPTVGGSGKTPLVIWLAGYLGTLGYKPGIVARGYGGRASGWPQQVRHDSDPHAVGEEAVLIARRTRCPVAVAPDRGAAVKALLEHTDCDVVISDDGLQHYALGRSIEIAVIDGVRRLGNRRLLPAGPLREAPSRLDEVDFIVTNGIAAVNEYAMKYVPVNPINLQRRELAMPFADFRDTPVHAVAGIGNPQRFFKMLKDKGLKIIPHVFPDHHRFKSQDLDFKDEHPILMTEKDAIKCEAFATSRCWLVPIIAELPDIFAQKLATLLKGGIDGQATAGNPGLSGDQGAADLRPRQAGADLAQRAPGVSDPGRHPGDAGGRGS